MVNPIYVPILKWKRAEAGALEDLYENQKVNVIPLLEILAFDMLSAAAKKRGLSKEQEFLYLRSLTIPSDILTSWGSNRSFFVDFTLVEPLNLKMEFVPEFFINCKQMNLLPVVVINMLLDNQEYQARVMSAAKKNQFNQVCIRLNRFETNNMELLNKTISDFSKKFKIEKAQISILVDLKENTDPACFHSCLTNILKIREINDFSNLIVASGAFPKDMSEFGIDQEENIKTRNDWQNWLAFVQNPVTRLPSFSDYTIRHPILDPIAMKHNPTCTIKYTVDDCWKILKGRKSTFMDYIANASLLSKQSYYFGKEFSAGDYFISQISSNFEQWQNNPTKKPKTGNTEQWLRAGINHHIAVVVSQLSKLHD